MMRPIRIVIVGMGKIARDEHVPAIAGDERFELAATVSRQGKGHPDLPCFASHEEMLEGAQDLDAVALCTPPAARYAIARDCIAAGLHVLLEKPPGVTLGEVEELARLAARRPVSLFTTWHAQYNPAVTAAAERLAGRRVRSMRIVWREDVRKWHPGQQWIWQPGGFGVFDPGINALSIASRIFPGALLVRSAELLFPENKQTPIAARLSLVSPAADGPLEAEFDWRQRGAEAWDIEIGSGEETLALTGGGKRLSVNGREIAADGPREYPALYQRFAELIGARESHVDPAPLRLAADAFLVGERLVVEPFED